VKVLKFGTSIQSTADFRLLILFSLIFLKRYGNFNQTKFRIKF